ncbi:unnamed protein product [Rodentolepis nana]|uniref:PITH domain-containing protein n=1 Tax=Rodentolepis nana TaxID=102285 RepID=A0A0R3TSK1_RODNA|nr:unnamed protein product [Rodentolepis nana]
MVDRSAQCGLTSSNLSALGFDSNTAEIIDLTNLKSCVEVKAQFTKASFTVDETAKLMVFLKSFTSFPLRFNGISVRLNHEALQGGPIAHQSRVSADFTSLCKWEHSFDLTPEEHIKTVVFTLDPTTLGSAVQFGSPRSFGTLLNPYEDHWPQWALKKLRHAQCHIPCAEEDRYDQDVHSL